LSQCSGQVLEKNKKSPLKSVSKNVEREKKTFKGSENNVNHKQSPNNRHKINCSHQVASPSKVSYTELELILNNIDMIKAKAKK
jgi:hypothetical protein